MKKSLYLKKAFFGILLTCMFGNTVFSNRVVEVACGEILSDFIHGDTLANGDRVHDTTIYVLNRDCTYEIDVALNLTVPLIIKAKNDTGKRPTIIAKTNINTGFYPYLINTHGDLILENLYIESSRGFASHPKWGSIRIAGTNSNVTLNGCYIEWDKGATVMLNAHGASVKIENCRIAKMGNRNEVNGNGRIVDCREFNTTKIDICNNTFYHFGDRLIRNMSGGKIDSLIFDHNTGAHIQGFHGTFHLGNIGYAKITNNLIINPKFMGNHSDISEQTGPSPDKDNHYLFTIDAIGTDTELEIHHNNLVFEQTVIDFFNSSSATSKPEVLSPLVASALGSEASNASFEEVIEFTNMPDLNPAYLNVLFATSPTYPTPENFPDNIGIDLIDATYSPSSLSYTAAEFGKPVGDLNWWSDKVEVKICSGDSYTLPDGAIINKEGIYTSTIKNQNYQDSTVYTTLVILPSYIDTIFATICEGDDYTLPDETTTDSSGIYEFNSLTSEGCDSNKVVVLTVNKSYLASVEVSLCDIESYTLPNYTVVTESGIYTSELETELGCDSIIVTNLVLGETSDTIINTTISAGETYTLADSTEITEQGVYVTKILSKDGCDSTITVALTVKPSSTRNSNNSENLLRIYPTVCKGMLTIESLTSAQEMKIEVLDITGISIETFVLNSTQNTTNLKLDLSVYNNGLYFIRANVNGVVFVKPVVLDKY